MCCESHNHQHIYDLLEGLTGPNEGYTPDYGLVKEKDTKEVDQAIGSKVLPHDIAQDVLLLFFLFYFCFVLRGEVWFVCLFFQHWTTAACVRRFLELLLVDHTGIFCVCEQLWLPKLQTPKRKADVYQKSYHLYKSVQTSWNNAPGIQKNLIMGNIPRATFLEVGQRSSIQIMPSWTYRRFEQPGLLCCLWCTSITFFHVQKLRIWCLTVFFLLK